MHLNLSSLKPRSITQKILATIFIISSIVTIVITAIQISFDYYTEMNTLKKSLMLVERSYSRSVVASLWELNETQIQTQLDGIVSIPGIESATITYKGKVLASSGFLSDRFIEKKIDLVHMEKSGSNNYLGQLIIRASVDQVLNKLLNRVFIIFITQFIKTLLVSALLFFSIQQLITKHLIQISSFVKNIDLKAKEKLRLNRGENPIFSSEDELESLVGSINEMRENLSSSYDELEQLNSEQRRQLEVSSRMSSLGEMAGGIAHEINNPLTIIGTSSRLLKKHIDSGETSPDKIGTYFEKIDKTTDRITKIINGMLMISRDASTENYSSVTWNEIISDVIALCGEKFSHMGIEIKINGTPETLNRLFSGRKIQLSQVLLNLLHNSYDAIIALSEKWIEINCTIEAQFFVVRITDSGKGIPFELHEKIMQPFFTTKEVGKGTGLGLSLSMSIIKNHGGTFFIDKSSPHTSFIIRIPLNREG